MKKLLPILILLATIFACSEAPETVPNPTTTNLSAETNTSQPDSTITVDSFPESTNPLSNLPQIDSSAHTFLQFDLVTLRIDRKEMTIDERPLISCHEDTLVLSLPLGTEPSGQYYYITDLDSSVEQIQLFQQYETSMSIADEGKHLDLLNWKHHVSEWEMLEKEGDTVMTPTFIPEEYTQFPTVKVKEIVKEVKRIEDETSDLKGRKNKDRHWSDLAKTMPSPTAYPGYVSISQVRVKLVLTLKTGEITKRMMIYQIPMGS